MLSHRQELSVMLPWNVGQLTGCMKTAQTDLGSMCVTWRRSCRDSAEMHGIFLQQSPRSAMWEAGLGQEYWIHFRVRERGKEREAERGREKEEELKPCVLPVFSKLYESDWWKQKSLSNRKKLNHDGFCFCLFFCFNATIPNLHMQNHKPVCLIWWEHPWGPCQIMYDGNSIFVSLSFFSFLFLKNLFSLFGHLIKTNKQTMIQIKIDQPFLMKYINLGYIVRKTTTGYSNTNLYNVLLSSIRWSTFNTYWSQCWTRHTGWKQSGLRSTKGDRQYNIKQSPLTFTGLNLHWMEFSVSI